MSDNSPEFSSLPFREFARTWDFKHETSSPRCPWSNGAVERQIQSVKDIICKCCCDGSDVYSALLAFRNTLIHDNLNVLYNRNLRDTLPRLNSFFKPKLFDKKLHDKFIKKAQDRQKFYHDRRGIKELEEIKVNSKVYVQMQLGGERKAGKVIAKMGIRSYKVKLEDNRILVRNRR